MRKFIVFNFITLDGYFKGRNGDIRWHKHDAGENHMLSRCSVRGTRFFLDA